MKRKNLILSMITMLLANVVYFAWMPYPKSFLKTLGSETFAFDLITNLIFFAIFAVVLLVSINSVAMPGNFLSKKNVISAVAVCITIQLGFDFIKFIAERLLRWYAPLSNDFFTVLILFVTALAMMKLLKVKNVNQKHFYTVFLPFAAIALTVFFMLDVRDIVNVRNAADKFVYSLFDTDLSHEGNAVIANTEFIYEIRNAVLDFLTCSAIMIALYFSATSKNIEDDEKYHTKKAHFVSRIAVAVMLSFFVLSIKTLAIPHNSIKEIRGPSNQSTTTLPVFHYDSRQVTLSRMTGYGTSKTVYNATRAYILYCNEHILEFDRVGDCYFDIDHSIGEEYSPDLYPTTENVGFFYDGYETISIGNTKVKICSNDKAIAYLKDDKPYAVRICDVNDEEFDGTLLAACEKLIEKGRISCFEYVGEYILKYDPDFIMPYIERYSAGNFTSEEAYQMGDIKPEYISKCAKLLND